jgi:uncharacterized membrane protein YdcZ (DUF606 family)
MISPLAHLIGALVLLGFAFLTAVLAKDDTNTISEEARKRWLWINGFTCAVTVLVFIRLMQRLSAL